MPPVGAERGDRSILVRPGHTPDGKVSRSTHLQFVR
jgi:hypothetical protein